MPYIGIFPHRKYIYTSLPFQFFYILFYLFEWKCRQFCKFRDCDQRICMTLHMHFDHIRRWPFFFPLQFFDHFRLESSFNLRIRLQNDTAANGFHRRIKTYNKFIATSYSNFFLHPELYISAFPRSDLFFVQKYRTAQDFTGPCKEMQPGVIRKDSHGWIQHI